MQVRKKIFICIDFKLFEREDLEIAHLHSEQQIKTAVMIIQRQVQVWADFSVM